MIYGMSVPARLTKKHVSVYSDSWMIRKVDSAIISTAFNNRAGTFSVMHLTELISVALGTKSYKKWFKKHLVDPMPMFKAKGIL